RTIHADRRCRPASDQVRHAANVPSAGALLSRLRRFFLRRTGPHATHQLTIEFQTDLTLTLHGRDRTVDHEPDEQEHAGDDDPFHNTSSVASIGEARSPVPSARAGGSASIGSTT